MFNVVLNVESLIREMYEKFLISVACSEFYAYEMQDLEAQEIIIFFRYMDRVELCKLASVVCKKFLKGKNEHNLLSKLRNLGLNDYVTRTREQQKNVNQ